jgi:hypothetical protein
LIRNNEYQKRVELCLERRKGGKKRKEKERMRKKN